MAIQAVFSEDLLSQFNLWGDGKRNALLTRYFSQDLAMPTLLGEEVEQRVIFRDDFKRHIHALSTQSKYELASLAQCVATLAVSPFAIFAEIYRLCNGSINASTCLKNIFIVPKHIILSIAKAAFYVARAANKVIYAASIGTGFLTWHGDERLVRLINGSSHTVLSNNQQIRDIVYDSIGLTMLAAAAVFIPVAPIQMLALPIIIGSIYGTVNNQFTVRECPEYYTMGHYYDGTDLKGHAIKTNNILIKPIVTGCYATTMVTKLAGAILAAVGTTPYTTAALPVPYACAMIAGVCLISLVAAQVFSSMKKNSVQRNLNAYAALIGIEWNEVNRNKKWKDLADMRFEHIVQKRQELALNAPELERFNQRLQELTKTLNPISSIPTYQLNTLQDGKPTTRVMGLGIFLQAEEL